MNKIDWFGIAPYGAGSPPALVLSIALYKAVMSVIDARLWIFAVLVAFLGVVGMMGVEISTYKMLARAFASREWKAAIFAFCGALVVTGLIVFSVYSGADTRSLLSSTAVMLVGYLAIMVREYLNTIGQRSEIIADQDLKRRELENKRLSELRKTELARVRLAKLATVQSSTVQAQVSTGQTGHKLDTVKLQQARDYMAANPNASGRDVAKALGVSPTTGNIYKAAV